MPASAVQTLSNQIQIKLNGTNLSNALMDVLSEAEIETSMYLPSMFTLRFHDQKLDLIDGADFNAGKAIEISMPDATTPNTFISLFKGEITAVEPEFRDDFVATLVVRGYDKGHRLNRGTKTQVFVDATDSDIVNKIAKSAGLAAQCDATTIVHKHVFQHALTNWEFLHERARRLGFEVLVNDSTLCFRKLTTTTGDATLVWGITLLNFQPRLTLAKQVDTVKVRGWDPKTKTALLGTASSSTSAPTVGISSWGGAMAQTAFGAAEVLEVRHPVRSQNEATAMAQSILDEINAGFLEADGVAYGNPALKPGVKVDIQKVGIKFSGKYVVTTVRHTYRTSEAFLSHFTVQGTRAQTMADLVDQSSTEQRNKQLWGGIVVGIVTNNTDPDNMGRIKVKFPWLDDALESNWAPVSAPGAGATRGILWMPEVNDEVLIAFEHGDFDYPYVVGAVWNGKDALPEATSTLVKNGKVEVRIMKTRGGQTIKMTDSDSAKTIEIIGSAGDTIKFDETSKKITIESKGDLDITATGTVNIKGMNVKIAASGQLEATAGSTGKLEASGPLTVKGAIVNIN